MAERRVVATEAFAAGLERIGERLDDERFDALVNLVTGRMARLLAMRPGVGRPFSGATITSQGGSALLARIRDRLGGGELRELVLGDCVVLYLVQRATVFLLAIRHHREQGFRLEPRR